jgi:hypothetical protein
VRPWHNHKEVLVTDKNDAVERFRSTPNHKVKLPDAVHVLAAVNPPVVPAETQPVVKAVEKPKGETIVTKVTEGPKTETSKVEK